MNLIARNPAHQCILCQDDWRHRWPHMHHSAGWFRPCRTRKYMNTCYATQLCIINTLTCKTRLIVKKILFYFGESLLLLLCHVEEMPELVCKCCFNKVPQTERLHGCHLLSHSSRQKPRTKVSTGVAFLFPGVGLLRIVVFIVYGHAWICPHLLPLLRLTLKTSF